VTQLFSCTAIRHHPICGATSSRTSPGSAAAWRPTSSAWAIRGRRRAARIGSSIMRAILMPGLALELTANVTLVLHDWGSALGLYRACRFPQQIRAIAYMEAIVQPRRWSDFPPGRDQIFRALRGPDGERLVLDENFFVETVLPKSVIRPLGKT